MEDYSNYTLIELNKMINDIQQKHEQLKGEIVNHSYEIENIERIVNDKLEILNNLEKKYIALIEEITKR
jgi:uncharacterized protein YlxW (UPF0749 family)